MSDVPADSAARPSAQSWPAEPKPPGEGWLPGPKPPDEAWSRRKFLFVLLFVLAFHVALIVLFGTKKRIVPRTVANVPHLELASRANELIALGDPTLFARPNAHDVVTAFWRREPPVTQPDFDWPAPPGFLLPASGNFGAVFRGFMRDSQPPEFALNLKPEPKAPLPDVAFNAVPLATTMQISGDLAQRPLLTSVQPPSILYNDVLAQSVIQALVDASGNVFSPIVLKSCGYNDADQRALQIVRNLSFAPGPKVTFGEITFTWRTLPTNAVPAAVP